MFTSNTTVALTCSSVTKHAISEFMKESAGFEETIYPVIIRGVRLFTFYIYRNDFEFTHMIVITKYGARKIHRLCEKASSWAKVQAILTAYFSKCLEDNPDRAEILDQLVRFISFHYHTRNDGEYSPYTSDSLSGKYLCILSPITRNLYRNIGIMLADICYQRKDDIIKDQLIIV